jgi:CBS domain-containing membrane protein
MSPQKPGAELGRPELDLACRRSMAARLSPADALWAPLLEGGLLVLVGAIAFMLRRPLLFASLGPTVYEQMEQPSMRSARLYSVVVGHLVGIAAGFLALWICHGWAAPALLSTGVVTWRRVLAAGLAVILTTVGNIVLKSQQPAAAATTLLVSLGTFQDWPGAQVLLLGVALVAFTGEPLRRWRLRQRQAAAATGKPAALPRQAA